MNILEELLGRCLSAQQVAEYLQCDITTVYKNYSDLGGVKLGRTYKFFEKGLVNALLQPAARKMAGTNSVQIQDVSQVVPQQKRGLKLGSNRKDVSGVSKRSRPYTHGILG